MKKQVGAVLAGTAAVGILATVTFGLAGQVGARPVTTNVVSPHKVHRDGDGAEHLASIASVLGMTTDEVHTALHSGQSLAEIATAKGIAVQSVVDAVVAEMKSHVASEVASGELTQAEADAKLADVVAKATAIVNGTPGRDMPGRHRGDRDERGPGRGTRGNIQPSAVVTESNA